MPPFSRIREEFGPDGQLFGDSPIVKYRSVTVLDEHIAMLKERGYHVSQFECEQWKSELDMFIDLKEKLDFPVLTRGLDGLSELFFTLEIRDTGTVLAFRDFDGLWTNAGFRPRTPWHLLDMIASNSRFHLLFGDRLFALIQVHDLEFTAEPFGAAYLATNPTERRLRRL